MKLTNQTKTQSIQWKLEFKADHLHWDEATGTMSCSECGGKMVLDTKKAEGIINEETVKNVVAVFRKIADAFVERHLGCPNEMTVAV